MNYLLIGFVLYLCSHTVSQNLVDIASLTDEELDQFLANPSTCVQIAMRAIFAECARDGIHAVDPKDRRASAIEMSVCEFEVSLLSYPVECSQPIIDYEACVRELGLVPQYWTTYNGNYQYVGLFCEGVSRTHEKEQIIELYLNITTTFAQNQDRFHESFRKSQDWASEMDKVFDQWSSEFKAAKDDSSLFFEFVYQQQERIHREVLHLLEAMLKKSEEQNDIVLAQSKQIMDKLGLISDNMEAVSGMFDSNELTVKIEEQRTASLEVFGTMADEAHRVLIRLLGETTDKFQEVNGIIDVELASTRNLFQSEVGFLFDSIIQSMEERLCQALENMDDRIELHLETFEAIFNESRSTFHLRPSWSFYFPDLSGPIRALKSFGNLGVRCLGYTESLVAEGTYFWSTMLQIPVVFVLAMVRFSLAVICFSVLAILVTKHFDALKYVIVITAMWALLPLYHSE